MSPSSAQRRRERPRDAADGASPPREPSDGDSTPGGAAPVDPGASTAADPSTAPEPSPQRPSDDVVFDVLAVRRRREVLRHLDENGGEATIGGLAEHVAAVENDVAVSEVTRSQRKRAYVALYQAHLPKMDDVGVVDWHEEWGHVWLTEGARWPLAYLRYEPEPAALPGEEDASLLESFLPILRRILSG